MVVPSLVKWRVGYCAALAVLSFAWPAQSTAQTVERHGMRGGAAGGGGVVPAAPASPATLPAAPVPGAAPAALMVPVVPSPGTAAPGAPLPATIPPFVPPAPVPPPTVQPPAQPPPAGRPPLPPAPPAQPVKGLPADAPLLVISGGVYSADRDRRMAIVNGKVVREGADLGSGVVLEQITPVGVVLGFRGAHYRLMY